MTDRTELLEAALDSFPEGVALLGAEGNVMFWNRAAEAITGYTGGALAAQPLPEALEPLLLDGARPGESQTGSRLRLGRGALVHARHKLGHELQAMARILMLCDGVGEWLGSAVVFHPALSLDALPHGTGGGDGVLEASQADLEDRLGMEFDDFARGGPPFGVLWIAVDQAQELRKSHGSSACETMLAKIEYALVHGLRPAEELGRWGNDEFLIISHERTPELLAVHAQTLAGLARTADFRWWGDRVSLTVSVGAAQADQAETLAQLLERAQGAMESSIHAGGNHITPAPRGHACLPL